MEAQPQPLSLLPDQPTYWRLSGAWLRKPHDCTLHGITERCGARCCNAGSDGTRWPASAFGTEPGSPCGYLGPQGCTLTACDRPVKCHLYPLVLKGSSVIRHFRAGPVCAGNAGQGPPLIDALRDSLVELFGVQEYERAREEILGGAEYALVKVPPEVVQAVAQEDLEEMGNEAPIPRGIR